MAAPSPDVGLTSQQRIDRFWHSFDYVDCMGMFPPETIEKVAEGAHLIAIGRPLGFQQWDDPHYNVPVWLLAFEIREVLKGSPVTQLPSIIQILSPGLSGSASDTDHLLFLNNRHQQRTVAEIGTLPGDELLYDLNYGYMSVYANVDGRVVIPEYRATKRAYGTGDLFSLDLHGTSFDRLVKRVQEAVDNPVEASIRTALRGYFAC